MMGVCCSYKLERLNERRGGNEHAIGTGTQEVGEEATERKKLNTEDNTEKMAR